MTDKRPRWAGFSAALQFLTVIPVSGKSGKQAVALAGSVRFFPLVGLLIGGIAAGLCYVIRQIFDPLLASVLIVAILAAASGGLHLDGLSDTADGFFSSRPRERILEIMRDSRVGAMGVISIMLILTLKIAALSALPMKRACWAVLLMPLAGRCALVLLIALLPYARPEGGLASLFYTRPVRWAAVWSVTLLFTTAWLVAGPAGLIISGVVIIALLLFAVYCHAKIGGATGDTLGAACELAETTAALALAAKPLLLL